MPSPLVRSGFLFLSFAASCAGCPASRSDENLDDAQDASLQRFDAGGDAGVDASVIHRPDASVDAGVDAGWDGGVDAGWDAGVDAGHDAGRDAGSDAGSDAGNDAGWDAGRDAGVDAGLDAGVDAGWDAGWDAGAPDAAVVYPTADSPGSYLYSPLPIGGLAEARAVAFHPSGSAAVVLESYNIVHVYDFVVGADHRYDVHASASLYFTGLAFEPAGGFALLTGYEIASGVKRGVVLDFAFDQWLAGETDPAVLFTFRSGVPASSGVMSVKYPSDGGEPALLFQTEQGGGNYTMALRRLDVAANTWTLLGARATSAGCADLAFVHGALGNPGILVVCGTNGYDALFWSEVAGVGQWREDLGNNLLGNTSVVTAHPSGDYALAVSWSGRALYRFQHEQMNSYGTAPRFSTRALWGAAFAPDGARALVYGQAMDISGTPRFGTVLEYRHDHYSCVQPLSSNCDLTEVSIPNFGVSPFAAPSQANLNHAAWRPGCAGGLIVGGKGAWGTVIKFQLEGGRNCF
ncbi:MAG: hypothetical protein HY904_09125 [Deltaproteobacteria bacterium]|nr:hypothetical protein [Deltaproteobacteria bacterium]